MGLDAPCEDRDGASTVKTEGDRNVKQVVLVIVAQEGVRKYLCACSEHTLVLPRKHSIHLRLLLHLLGPFFLPAFRVLLCKQHHTIEGGDDAPLRVYFALLAHPSLLRCHAMQFLVLKVANGCMCIRHLKPRLKFTDTRLIEPDRGGEGFIAV